MISGNGGTVTINGGTVTAYGGSTRGGAGIGSGYYGDGGTITINGGTVTASGKNGAGIGGGYHGASGTVTINGGTVAAYGGSLTGYAGAGIGGGSSGASCRVNISGGTVTAVGGSNGGAGIGGGIYSAGGTITITDGTVFATGNGGGAGIGGGGTASYNTQGAGGTINISGGTVTATAVGTGAGIGGGGRCPTASDETGGTGGNITISGGMVTATSNGKGAGIGGGNGRTAGTVTVNGGTVTATAGSGVTTFTGYDAGGPIAGYYNYGGGAGIGGGYIGTVNASNTTVTVNGGEVKASGAGGGAGIGGGYYGEGVAVTVNGGSVTAVGSLDTANNIEGAGIGGGATKSGGTLTINFSNDEDSLTAGSYTGTVGTTTDISDGSNVYLTGVITSLNDIAGKTLRKNGLFAVIFSSGSGGSGIMSPAVRSQGEIYNLPVCGFTSSTGKTFRAWSVKIGDGNAAIKFPDEPITVTTDTTVTAVWAYNIMIENDFLHGSAFAEGSALADTMADEDETARLTFTPDADYVLSGYEIAYIDGDGSKQTVDAAQDTDDEWTFNMPAADVTVRLRYKPVSLSYMDYENGAMVEKTLGKDDYQVLAPWMDEIREASGIYAVTDDENMGDTRLTVIYSDVKLILCDGAVLTASKGIYVPQSTITNLTICGQSGGTGSLIIDNVESRHAGIGGGFGTRGGASGPITINGGTVTAFGGSGNGAGIGGGASGACGTIIINGGTVTATGGGSGSGLGYGSNSSSTGSVTINGGTVTATGGSNGNGIAVSNVTINGGTVNATAKSSSRYGIRGSVTVGFENAGDSLTANSYNRSLTVKSGCSISNGTANYTDTITSANAKEKTLRKTGTYIIAFNANGGIGTMASAGVTSGGSYTLPECGFTAQDGKAFKEWSVKTGTSAAVRKDPADEITVTADTAVTAIWESVPSFKTQSLLLSGQIGAIFYMDLPDLDNVDYSTSYMTFTITGSGSVSADPVPFNENQKNAQGNLYGFTCYINSIQMADKITATFHYFRNNTEITIDREFAAMDYFASFDAAGITDPTTVAVVHALADFGHYVQPFLSSVRNWTVGTDYADMTKYYSNASNYDYNAIKTAVSGKALNAVNETGGDIKTVTNSLTLDSNTVINVYFRPSEGYNGTFTASVDNGAAATYTKGSDGRYCVQISGIPAHELSTDHTIAVTTAEGHTMTVTVSALSYVYSALNYYTGNSEIDTAARNAVAAVWAYSRAADAYKAAHQN